MLNSNFNKIFVWIYFHILITSAKKRDKVRAAAASSEFTFYFFLGEPQRSFLCPLFFLIYINNLSNHIVSTDKKLAADDVLFFIKLQLVN